MRVGIVSASSRSMRPTRRARPKRAHRRRPGGPAWRRQRGRGGGAGWSHARGYVRPPTTCPSPGSSAPWAMRPFGGGTAPIHRGLAECAVVGQPQGSRMHIVIPPCGPPVPRAAPADAETSTAMTPWLSVLQRAAPGDLLRPGYGACGIPGSASSAVRRDELEDCVERPRPDEVRALFPVGHEPGAEDVPAGPPRHPRTPSGPAEQGVVLTDRESFAPRGLCPPLGGSAVRVTTTSADAPHRLARR